MKKWILGLFPILLCVLLAGCGATDPELEQFQADFEEFCINVSMLDTSINGIDASSENATAELLDYIDQLEMEFQRLAAMDFPEDYDYLEQLSQEAGEYMSTAAEAYHTAYESEPFAENYSDFAFENYRRAYRRVQVIIIYLHGEQPQEQYLSGE